GTLIADDDDVAGLDAAVRDRVHRRLLALEDAGRPGVATALVAGELDDAAVGGEVAAQDGQAAGGLDRIRQRPDDLLAGRLGRRPGDLADRRVVDGRRVLVQHTGLLQALQEDRDAAGVEEVDGVVVAARLEVAEQRRAVRDAVEVVDVELDAGLARHGEEVQHGVGAPAAGGDGRDRVLQRLARDDVARALSAAQDVHDQTAGRLRDV